MLKLIAGGMVTTVAAISKSTSHALMPLPNVDYLSSGYNVYYGNPRSTQSGSDPGFKQKIFDFDYNEQLTTDDLRYLVPDGTSFKKDDGCKLDFSSEIISGTSSYYKSLNEEASSQTYEKDDRFQSAFSASPDYQRIDKGSSQFKNKYLQSKAECSVYAGNVMAYTLPKFDVNFENAVLSLQEDYETNEDKYLTFIEFFGTHYVLDVKMGSKFGFISEFSEEGWWGLTSTNSKIEQAASSSSLKQSGSNSTLTEEQQEAAESFNSKRRSYSIFTLGSQPPSSGKVEDWASSSFSEPMPIRYNLRVISELITSKNFPIVKNTSQIRENIDKALGNYCNHLKQNGVVDSCDHPD